MNQQHKAELNHFFVTVFNQILAWEERTLAQAAGSELSVKEYHILEAVNKLAPGDKNTMTNVAGTLSISVSALTTAVGALVRKGYVLREPGQGDRRIIRVVLTPKGSQAVDHHQRFHEEMIEEVATYMTPEQLETLVLSLNRLRQFFGGKIGIKTNAQSKSWTKPQIGEL